MEKEQIVRILRGLPDDGSQDEAAAQELRESSRADARTLVETWRGRDVGLANRAERVLIELGDPVVVPVLEPPPPGSPEALAQSLKLAVDAELGLRETVIKALDAALDDKRLLEAPRRMAPAEETVPPQRVCDRAYLLMRAMVHFGEDELERDAGMDNFVHLPKDVRDSQIARARKTGTWQRLVVGEEVERYVAPDTPPSSGLPPRR